MAPVTAKLAGLGGPNGAKIIKKMISKSICFWMPLRIDVLSDFDRFLVPKWSQVGTKNGIINRPQLRQACFQKNVFSHRKIMVFEIQWVEVGSQKRSNIDPKMKSSWEGILAFVFLRF